MPKQKLNVEVHSDLDEVVSDLQQLEYHIESLGNTIERLNNRGLNVKIKMSADTNKLLSGFEFLTR
jgi:prefoldin subunit 5